MNINKFFSSIALLVFSNAVFAEGNCPSGYFPTGGGTSGVYGCAPMNNNSSPGGQQAPADTGPLWQKRWGAIAVDGENSRFAGVDGFSTPSKAKKSAIKQCRSKGGKKCKILIDYYNQCGALAWGDERYIAHRGPVVEDAMRRGVEACNKETSNCQIYYSGCSYPERVQ